MRSKDKEYTYIVAWVDSLNKKSRWVLTCGEHDKVKDYDDVPSNLLSYD